MAGPQRQFKAREKSYLSEYSMNLQGPVQAGAQFPAEFRMAFAANKVAIQVETKNRDNKNNGRFEIVVPYLGAIGVLNTIDKLIQDKARSKLQYKVKDFVYFGKGNKSDSPMIKGTLTVGRDNEGCLYIGMSGKDITPIKFIFALPAHDELCDDSGQRLGDAEHSEFAAKNFVVGYLGLLPVVMGIHYTPPEPKNPDGGNGGGGGQGGGGWGGNGGGNRGGGNGGGNQYGQGGNQGGGNASGSGSSGGGDFADDLPF
ncbi:hypothetical protein RAY_240 [Erwinia phage vB_EamM_RAY]|uniref:Uncharacterized protein n=1 Tax=Erwinia phage vB_EamM_RAY TaxID=1815987 RepID=A0A173GEF9_9CAUD|nr:hypothetical protein FDH98_gp278 [Erwinia phage vB_EamM_RAY]ANH52020.1 hypothetical protein RAY_240 [Erwinia phage vB_EamM_RAY]